MGRAVSQRTSAMCFAVVLLVGAALVSPAATPDLLVVTLALLALTATALAAWSVVGPRSPGMRTPIGVRADLPMPRGRVTDPAHHPIAPRAPGPA